MNHSVGIEGEQEIHHYGDCRKGRFVKLLKTSCKVELMFVSTEDFGIYIRKEREREIERVEGVYLLRALMSGWASLFSCEHFDDLGVIGSTLS